MNYFKAQKILPDKVLKAVQKYIDGEYIYIPRKDQNRRAWGEKNGYKNSLEKRNRQIYDRYLDGAKVEDLIREFFLSEQSIKRILNKQKKLV